MEKQYWTLGLAWIAAHLKGCATRAATPQGLVLRVRPR